MFNALLAFFSKKEKPTNQNVFVVTELEKENWTREEGMTQKIFFYIDGDLVYESNIALHLDEPHSAFITVSFWDNYMNTGKIAWTDGFGSHHVINDPNKQISYKLGEIPEYAIEASRSLSEALVGTR